MMTLSHLPKLTKSQWEMGSAEGDNGSCKPNRADNSTNISSIPIRKSQHRRSIIYASDASKGFSDVEKESPPAARNASCTGVQTQMRRLSYQPRKISYFDATIKVSAKSDRNCQSDKKSSRRFSNPYDSNMRKNQTCPNENSDDTRDSQVLDCSSLVSVSANCESTSQSPQTSDGSLKTRTESPRGRSFSPNKSGITELSSNLHYEQHSWSTIQLSSSSASSNEPFPRAFFGCTQSATQEGDVFIFGGCDDQYHPLNDFWKINTRKFPPNFVFQMCLLTLNQNLVSGHTTEFYCGGPNPDARSEPAVLLVDENYLGMLFLSKIIIADMPTVIFGGQPCQEERGNYLYVLDISTKLWRKLDLVGECEIGRFAHSMCLVGDKIYIFGGQWKNNLLNDMIAISLKQLANNPVHFEDVVLTNPSCPSGRKRHSFMSRDNLIFTFGGTNGVNCLNDTWMFNTNNATWTLLDCKGQIPSPRHYQSACLIGNCIFISGGKDADDNVLHDFYALDLSTLEWRYIENLSRTLGPRFGHSLISFGTKLAVVGGCTLSEANLTFCDPVLYSFNSTKLSFVTKRKEQYSNQLQVITNEPDLGQYLEQFADSNSREGTTTHSPKSRNSLSDELSDSIEVQDACHSSKHDESSETKIDTTTAKWLLTQLSVAKAQGYIPKVPCEIKVEEKDRSSFNQLLMVMENKFTQAKADIDKEHQVLLDEISVLRSERAAAIGEALYATAKLASYTSHNNEILDDINEKRIQSLEERLARSCETEQLLGKELYSLRERMKIEQIRIQNVNAIENLLVKISSNCEEMKSAISECITSESKTSNFRNDITRLQNLCNELISKKPIFQENYSWSNKEKFLELERAVERYKDELQSSDFKVKALQKEMTELSRSDDKGDHQCLLDLRNITEQIDRIYNYEKGLVTEIIPRDQDSPTTLVSKLEKTQSQLDDTEQQLLDLTNSFHVRLMQLEDDQKAAQNLVQESSSSLLTLQEELRRVRTQNTSLSSQLENYKRRKSAGGEESTDPLVKSACSNAEERTQQSLSAQLDDIDLKRLESEKVDFVRRAENAEKKVLALLFEINRSIDTQFGTNDDATLKPQTTSSMIDTYSNELEQVRQKAKGKVLLRASIDSLSSLQ